MVNTVTPAMTPSERLPYSAIIDRPALPAPNKAKIIVWPIVNVEHWDISRPMARQVIPPPTGVTSLPDIANWSWHEYGMRVGFWRLKAMFDRLGITPTLSINGNVCNSYPRIAEAALEKNWEFMGHGYIQMPVHAVADQLGMIEQTLEVLNTFTGKQVCGWLGPGLTQTMETVDLLSASGIQYIADWVLDDEPCRLRTTSGSMLALPYTVEHNDIPVIAVQHHSASEFRDRIKNSFDYLYREGEERVRIMGIALHPFLSGVPHRMRFIEEAFDYMHQHADVSFMTGEQISSWYEQVAAPQTV